jgi:hypothetical protein
MEYVKIVLFSIGVAITYGVLQDQITARVCVEYFTVGHPSLLGTRDPTVLGFAWGIIATWWVGLPLGVLLALVARLGPWPGLTIRDVWRPILTLMLGVGLTSMLAGLVGYILARSGDASIPYYYAASVPQVRQALFVADAWAHENAYTVGTVGGVVVCVWAWCRRGHTTIRQLWRRVLRLLAPTWDTSVRPSIVSRLLTIGALAVLVLGTLNLATSWFTMAGDLEPAYFALTLAWPVVLLAFWILGTAALLTARQPRAAAVLLVLCPVVGMIVAAYLFGMPRSTGVSLLESFIILDIGVIYAAWRLVLRLVIVRGPSSGYTRRQGLAAVSF